MLCAWAVESRRKTTERTMVPADMAGLSCIFRFRVEGRREV